ncbi:ATP-binding protein [Mesobacillus zeae]|uniref:ATP-binding protein n=1 Tax=Mesobacillus zeae TaxID=1917180 RepID=A0A398B8D3_9BACI|nr:ATP-binding protein [Mesobacillus zeae]RID85744.1 ATP-binding protein [Mesobacillus zeae]
MRDVLIIPFTDEMSIIIASDNSGAIGMKPADSVKVPYDTLGYYSLRVAAMECIAAGGEPFAVTLHNFCGETAWNEITAGIRKGLSELGIEEVELTGSTETNFPMEQSALSINVLGKKKKGSADEKLHYDNKSKIAVIGAPLVGNDVIKRSSEGAPLAVFKEVASHLDIITLPVGSKGILAELNVLFSNRHFKKSEIETDVDLLQSAGPSTCFIAVYNASIEEDMKNMTGPYFHSVKVQG